MADGTQFVNVTQTGGTPEDYLVSGAASIDLLAVRADFDGTGAGGDFLPVLQILNAAGQVELTFPGSTVVAGDSASVTFAPFLRGQQTAVGAGGIHYGENQNTGTDPPYLGIEVTGDGVTPNDGSGFSVTVDGTGPAYTAGAIALVTDSTAAGKVLVQNNSVGGSGIDIENNGSLTGTGRPGIDIENNAPADAGQKAFVIANNATGDMQIDNGAGALSTFVHDVYTIEARQGMSIDVDFGNLTLLDLPVTNPGGTGNVWNNGGVLHIT